MERIVKRKRISSAKNSGETSSDTTIPFKRVSRNSNNEPVRLNKYVAQSGVCSRRDADQLIAEGLIKVNGEVVTQLGTKVLTTDKVEFNGKTLQGERKIYIIMNKPKGYVTSLEDPHNDQDVIDLLNGKIKERVYPVGRLDKNTTGVLLITNDGDLTEILTHPSYEKKKIYHASLDRPASEQDLQKLVNGIELEDEEDGTISVSADEVSFVDSSRKEVGIEIHSGRNRIVRRMFEAIGYEVKSLDRVYFAGLTKLGLKRSWWRELTNAEIAMLKTGRYE